LVHFKVWSNPHTKGKNMINSTFLHTHQKIIKELSTLFPTLPTKEETKDQESPLK